MRRQWQQSTETSSHRPSREQVVGLLSLRQPTFFAQDALVSGSTCHPHTLSGLFCRCVQPLLRRCMLGFLGVAATTVAAERAQSLCWQESPDDKSVIHVPWTGLSTLQRCHEPAQSLLASLILKFHAFLLIQFEVRATSKRKFWRLQLLDSQWVCRGPLDPRRPISLRTIRKAGALVVA